VTDLALDSNKDKQIRVNFNITMMDLPCKYATIDVVSVLGTQQNVTQHISRWDLDANGVRNQLKDRNHQQHDVMVELYDKDLGYTLEELHEDGENAVSLDQETLTFALHKREYVFVDFYASWCSHCRDLAPTWEALAEVMDMAADEHLDEKIIEEEEDTNGTGTEHNYNDEEYAQASKLLKPVFIGKVDCVIRKELCMAQGIRAYPTLRLFVDGKRHPTGDYAGDRTVLGMSAYLQLIEEEHKEGTDKELTVDRALDRKYDSLLWDVCCSLTPLFLDTYYYDSSLICGSFSFIMSLLLFCTTDAKELMWGDEEDAEEQWDMKMKLKKHQLQQMWRDEDHPGCQVTGFLMIDRAPGNFRIQARSRGHDLAAHMTNSSHEIHHLSFGEPSLWNIAKMGQLKDGPDNLKNLLAPMDGNVYITYNLHEAHHHYLKVITTRFLDPNLPKLAFVKKLLEKDGVLRGYQILQSSQLSYYQNDIVPGRLHSIFTTGTPHNYCAHYVSAYNIYFYMSLTAVVVFLSSWDLFWNVDCRGQVLI
jgi:thiol-disulfide isomerase/thioredoxin